MAKTILVVEDDPDMRELIASHLQTAGYAVRTAANGLHAAAACVTAKPDLIISDVHMPRMGGFDMIKILKSEEEMKDIPVIFLTVDEEKRGRGSELGAVAYLTKPIQMDALMKALLKHLPVKG
jgi:CheY-like chemotaxis protein